MRLQLLGFLSFGLLTIAIAGCTSSVVGSGDGGQSAARTGFTPGEGETEDGEDPENPTTSGTATLYESFFDAPASDDATDTLPGLWTGKAGFNEVRLKLTSSKISIAMRCDGKPAIGLEVAAQVTADTIRVSASKSVGGGTFNTCGIEIAPTAIPRCQSEFDNDCFLLSGTSLKFQMVTLFTNRGFPSREFTKVSD